MLYSVKYKKSGWLFWRTLQRVKGDGLLIDSTHSIKSTYGYRWFILDNETRIEIPMKDMIFKFSRERFYTIKKSMESEAGQPIITK